MLHVMSYALVDTLNILLIGVVVAAGVMLPAAEKGGRYGRVATLLILGDWLGVLVLALLSLLVFDGIGDAVGTFVDSPVFGILLILTGVFIAVMAWRGGDDAALIERILGPLRTPTVATFGTGFVLGLVQSVTSGPFFAGILVMSAGDFTVVTRYVGMIGYACVALSLPFLTALVVGYVRRRPYSRLGRGFAVMQRNRATVARGAGYLGAVLLTLLGITHLL
ncbi:membrane protein [Corynebacterium nuruki]|uniref:membrane protein n=1 Tax=Corynebacterium nuruki TaxID=1032851 RepID=UPI0002485A30|nr:membrane protein [Corynebacterium nuruki]